VGIGSRRVVRLARMFPGAGYSRRPIEPGSNSRARLSLRAGERIEAIAEQGHLDPWQRNMVHNLRMVVWQDKAYDWAIEFDATLKQFDLVRGPRFDRPLPQVGPGSAPLRADQRALFAAALYPRSARSGRESRILYRWSHVSGFSLHALTQDWLIRATEPAPDRLSRAGTWSHMACR